MNARMMIASLAALVAVFGPTLRAHAADKQDYLIVSPHTPEECLKTLDTYLGKDQKTLAKMDWGCMSGDHTGYLKVSADSEQAALALLPEAQRASAKVIPLNKFTPEQIKSFHAKK
jgi:hypothetical protein